VDLNLILEKGQHIFQDFKDKKLNIIQLIQEVVKLVESIASEFGGTTGKEKKEIAIQAIQSVIDIPFVPEWVEDRVIVLLVDFIVDLFNRKFGKRWIETLPKDKL